MAKENKLSLPKTIAFTGGKGGVGKTTAALNVSILLSRRGKEVLLLDADLGLGNVHVLLGLEPEYTAADVISGERSLSESLVEGPEGLKLLPATPGMMPMAQLDAFQERALIQSTEAYQKPIDYFMIDTAAGISRQVLNFTAAASEVVVVVCNEPTSLADAYALIKLVYRQNPEARFHVLANMVRSNHEGEQVFAKIRKVTERFLGVALRYIGAVPADSLVRKAHQAQKAVVTAYPSSRTAQALARVADQLEKWPTTTTAQGRIAFFEERRMVNGHNGAGSFGLAKRV